MVQSLRDAMALSEDCRVITIGTPPYSIVHTNKAWSQLTGYKFTEVANRTNSFLQGPSTDRKAVRKLKAAIDAGKHAKVSMVNYTKEGVAFLNTIDCFPLRDSQGTLTHFCGVISGKPVAADVAPNREVRQLPLTKSQPAPQSHFDEEERVRAKVAEETVAMLAPTAAKRQKRDQAAEDVAMRPIKLHDAINNVDDAIVISQVPNSSKEDVGWISFNDECELRAAPPYPITHVNAPWCEMCGYDAAEVEGKTCEFLQGPETDKALLADLMATVRRGEAASATVVNYDKAGKRFLNHLQMSPLLDDDGKVDMYIALLKEVEEEDFGAESATPVVFS